MGLHLRHPMIATIKIAPPDVLLREWLHHPHALTVGAFLAGAAANFGLRFAGKATYARGAIGGAVLGAIVGAVTATACPLVLLISSTNIDWATTMIQRSFIVGGLMGMTNGFFAGLTIVYFVGRQHARTEQG